MPNEVSLAEHAGMYESVLDDPKRELQYQLLKVSYALQEAGQAIVEAFKPVIEKIIEAIRWINSNFWNYLHSYVPKRFKRVAYLAAYGRKYRIRKKNRKRILHMWCRNMKEKKAGKSDG